MERNVPKQNRNNKNIHAKRYHVLWRFFLWRDSLGRSLSTDCENENICWFSVSRLHKFKKTCVA